MDVEILRSDCESFFKKINTYVENVVSQLTDNINKKVKTLIVAYARKTDYKPKTIFQQREV